MISTFFLCLIQGLGILLLLKCLPWLWDLLKFCLFVKKKQITISTSSAQGNELLLSSTFFTQKIIGRQNEELIISSISNDLETNKAMVCLQESYSEDPLTKYFVEEYSFKDSIIQQDFKINLNSKVSDKIILQNTDQQFLSAAIWYDSENYKYFLNPYDDLKQQLLDIYYFLKELGLKKGIDQLSVLKKKGNFIVTNFEEKKKTIMKSYEKEGYFYIYAIGTVASCRGKGYGEILMKWILNIADQQKKAVYLESSNPLNLNFYRRLGFEIKDQLKLPTQEQEIMSFLIRKPQLKQE